MLRRIVVGLAVATLSVTTGFAQTPAPAAPAASPFVFPGDAGLILNYVKADKTADFESTWGSIRAALAKSTKDDVKAFGESLTKLYKVDQPPIEGKTVLYILQIDAPSTTISYHPFKLVYEQLWNADEKLSLIPRAEADTIFEKLKASFQNINPPWKLIKVG